MSLLFFTDHRGFIDHRGRKRKLLRYTALVAAGALLFSGCKRKDDDYLLGPDQDGDGWPLELDCHDRDETIFPSADDIPGDGIDQDCSGSDAEPFSFGGGGNGGNSAAGGADSAGGSGGEDTGVGGDPSLGIDTDGDGYLAPPEGDDCDDERTQVHPDAVEIVLNGIDENCDGSDLVGGVDAISFIGDEAVLGEAPDLAAVEIDGGTYLLVIWADSRTAVRQDVYGQLLDLEGEKVGDEISIDTVDNNAKSGVRLVGKGDGFLAVWATADGVFAQQLHDDGTKRGILFGMGEPGSQRPVPAYGGEATDDGGAWAVAWVRPGDDPGTQAQIRAMSTDTEAIRAPIVDLGGATDAISSATIVGTPTGFLAAWEGPIGEGRGLVGHTTNRTGQLQGASQTIFEGSVQGPALASDGSSFFAAFRLSGPFGYAAGKPFASLSDIDDPSDFVRLSSESVAQEDFRVVPTESGYFAAWNDSRHWSHNPSIDAVYGNAWSAAEGARWSASRAFYAATDVELGGIVVLDGVMYQAVKVGTEGHLVRTSID